MHYIALKGDDISLIEYESPFFCTECDASSECHDGNWKFRLVRFHDLDLPGALRKIIEKFKKVMPAAAVIRYFQIENRFNILRKAKIIKMIPLATPPKLSADMAIVTTDVVEMTTENNQSK